jgi:hypothetical protein
VHREDVGDGTRGLIFGARIPPVAKRSAVLGAGDGS